MKPSPVDPEALLCALVLAPRTFPRNRFFSLFEDAAMKRVRRRAARVRGIIRQLTTPGQDQAEILGEQELEDGRTLIRFRVGRLSLRRTTALSALEAATLRYALHRGQGKPVEPRDRALVEGALEKLGVGLPLPSAP